MKKRGPRDIPDFSSKIAKQKTVDRIEQPKAQPVRPNRVIPKPIATSGKGGRRGT